MCQILLFSILSILTIFVEDFTEKVSDFMAICFTVKEPVLLILVIVITSVLSGDLMQLLEILKEDAQNSDESNKFIRTVLEHKNDLEWIENLGQQYRGIRDTLQSHEDLVNCNLSPLNNDWKSRIQDRNNDYEYKFRQNNNRYSPYAFSPYSSLDDSARDKRQSLGYEYRPQIRVINNGLTGALRPYNLKHVPYKRKTNTINDAEEQKVINIDHEKELEQLESVPREEYHDILGLRDYSQKEEIMEENKEYLKTSTEFSEIQHKNNRYGNSFDRNGNILFPKWKRMLKKSTDYFNTNPECDDGKCANVNNNEMEIHDMNIPEINIGNAKPNIVGKEIVEEVFDPECTSCSTDNSNQFQVMVLPESITTGVHEIKPTVSPKLSSISVPIILPVIMKSPIKTDIESYQKRDTSKIIQKQEVTTNHSSVTQVPFVSNPPIDIIHSKNYHNFVPEKDIYIDTNKFDANTEENLFKDILDTEKYVPEYGPLHVARMQPATAEPAHIFSFEHSSQKAVKDKAVLNEMTEEEKQKAAEEAHKLMEVDKEFNERNEPELDTKSDVDLPVREDNNKSNTQNNDVNFKSRSLKYIDMDKEEEQYIPYMNYDNNYRYVNRHNKRSNAKEVIQNGLKKLKKIFGFGNDKQEFEEVNDAYPFDEEQSNIINEDFNDYEYVPRHKDKTVHRKYHRKEKGDHKTVKFHESPKFAHQNKKHFMDTRKRYKVDECEGNVPETTTGSSTTSSTTPSTTTTTTTTTPSTTTTTTTPSTTTTTQTTTISTTPCKTPSTTTSSSRICITSTTAINKMEMINEEDDDYLADDYEQETCTQSTTEHMQFGPTANVSHEGTSNKKNEETQIKNNEDSMDVTCAKQSTTTSASTSNIPVVNSENLAITTVSEVTSPATTEVASTTISEATTTIISETAETIVSEKAPTTISEAPITIVSEEPLTTVSEAAKTTISETVATTVSEAFETTVSEATASTFSEAVPNTVSETTASTFSEAVPNTVSETAETTVSEVARTTVSETTVSEVAPPTVSKTAETNVSEVAPTTVSETAETTVSEAAPPTVSEAGETTVSEVIPLTASEAAETLVSEISTVAISEISTTNPETITVSKEVTVLHELTSSHTTSNGMSTEHTHPGETTTHKIATTLSNGKHIIADKEQENKNKPIVEDFSDELTMDKKLHDKTTEVSHTTSHKEGMHGTTESEEAATECTETSDDKKRKRKKSIHENTGTKKNIHHSGKFSQKHSKRSNNNTHLNRRNSNISHPRISRKYHAKNNTINRKFTNRHSKMALDTVSKQNIDENEDMNDEKLRTFPVLPKYNNNEDDDMTVKNRKITQQNDKFQSKRTNNKFRYIANKDGPHKFSLNRHFPRNIRHHFEHNNNNHPKIRTRRSNHVLPVNKYSNSQNSIISQEAAQDDDDDDDLNYFAPVEFESKHFKNPFAAREQLNENINYKEIKNGVSENKNKRRVEGRSVHLSKRNYDANFRKISAENMNRRNRMDVNNKGKNEHIANTRDTSHNDGSVDKHLKDEALKGQLAAQIVESIFNEVESSGQLQRHIGPGLKKDHTTKPFSHQGKSDEHQNLEDQKQLENMQQNIMKSLNKLIDEEMQRKTCVPLDPHSAVFLEQLTNRQNNLANSYETELDMKATDRPPHQDAFLFEEPRKEKSNNTHHGTTAVPHVQTSPGDHNKPTTQIAHANEPKASHGNQNVTTQHGLTTENEQHTTQLTTVVHNIEHTSLPAHTTQKITTHPTTLHSPISQDEYVEENESTTCNEDAEKDIFTPEHVPTFQIVTGEIPHSVSTEYEHSTEHQQTTEHEHEHEHSIEPQHTTEHQHTTGHQQLTEHSTESSKTNTDTKEMEEKKERVKRLMKMYNNLPQNDRHKFCSVYQYLHKQNIFLDRVIRQIKKSTRSARYSQEYFERRPHRDQFYGYPRNLYVPRYYQQHLKPRHQIWSQQYVSNDQQTPSDKYMKLVKRAMYYRRKREAEERLKKQIQTNTSGKMKKLEELFKVTTDGREDLTFNYSNV